MGSTVFRECGNMSFEISYIEDGKYMLVEITGAANVPLLKEMVEEVISHPNWHELIPGLIDFRGFTAASLTSDDVYELADVCRNLGRMLGSGNCALVMSKEIDFGLARMWQMMTEGHVEMEIDIFKSIEEAREWLLS